MQIRPEYMVYTDEQMAGMAVIITTDEDPDAPSVALNSDTGQLIAIVRKSFAIEDEANLRENLNIVRIDWLSVLGYDENRKVRTDVQDIALY